MVGCNACGQASLSALVSTASALLGYRDFRPDYLGQFHETVLDRTICRQVPVGVREEEGCLVSSSSDGGFRFVFVVFVVFVVVGVEEAMNDTVMGEECGDDWVKFNTRTV